ncbi:MAG: glycoside hydrolase N-terminal domain-containing protein [Propionicimonas sp.]
MDESALAPSLRAVPVGDGESLLWYRQPAEEFIEALPIGNGLIGAMTYGRLGGDLLRLNEGSAWSGGPGSAAVPDLDAAAGAALLARARGLVDAGDPVAAEEHLRAFQAGHSQAFLPFADLAIAALDADASAPQDGGPQRWLDLREATAGHRYVVAGSEVHHRTFASHPDRVLVHTVDVRSSDGSPRPTRFAVCAEPRLRAADGLAWSIEGGVARGYLEQLLPSDVSPDHEVRTGNVRYSPASRHGGLALAVVASPDAELALDPDDHSRVLIADATALFVVVATGTTLAGGLPHADAAPDRDALRALLAGRVGLACEHGVGALHERHVDDHRALWNRSRLHFEAAAPALPTDERLALSAERGGDLGMLPLLYGYGRYLLIASSRPGGFPAHLQGLWNIEPVPPWSSNYTININTQMNYWAALPTGLAECAEPLLDLIELLADTGRAAAAVYGASGWVAHHNTDPWGQAAAVGAGIGDACWSAWPMGGVWLCRHVADHVRHTGDAALARRFLPVVEGACRFASDWITRDADGSPRTSPATSPENHYVTPDGLVAAVATSTTMDVALLRDLARTAALLHDLARNGDGSVSRHPDADWLPAFTDLVAALPDPHIGPDGEVGEFAGTFAEFEPHHRHTSHLVGIHPLGSWTPESTPELWAAAKRSLDRRGPGSTGWSLAWHLCLSARLGDADRAAESLRRAVRPPADDGPHSGGLCPNLFSTHPPFQIDGSFGLVAGLVELLAQWEPGRLTLLPAVPSDWPDGSVTGLHGPDGWTLDLRWQGRTPVEARLTHDGRSGAEGVDVRWPGGRSSVRVEPGRTTILTTTNAFGSEG